MTTIDRLMQEGEGRCHWCGVPVILRRPDGNMPKKAEKATIDHVYPRGDPRRAYVLNDRTRIYTVLSCFTCNNNRGNLPYTAFLLIMRPEWREFVEEIVA